MNSGLKIDWMLDQPATSVTNWHIRAVTLVFKLCRHGKQGGRAAMAQPNLAGMPPGTAAVRIWFDWLLA